MMAPLVEPGHRRPTAAGTVSTDRIKSAAVAVVAVTIRFRRQRRYQSLIMTVRFLNCGNWSVLGIISDKPIGAEDAVSEVLSMNLD